MTSTTEGQVLCTRVPMEGFPSRSSVVKHAGMTDDLHHRRPGAVHPGADGRLPVSQQPAKFIGSHGVVLPIDFGIKAQGSLVLSGYGASN